jgi:transcription termination/antitermination protein NusG
LKILVIAHFDINNSEQFDPQLKMTEISNKLSWFAIYTAPRAEKKVSERFSALRIEHYLPLQKVKRIWSDRIKEVSVPIINGYIFVNITPQDASKVTAVYGALAFIHKAGIPIVIPENQINRMRVMVDYSTELVEFSTEKFDKGKNITINRGPLQGLRGELVEVNGKHKVLIRLEGFGSALTTIPISFICK